MHYSNAPYLLAKIITLINLIMYWQIHSFPHTYVQYRLDCGFFSFLLSKEI